MDLNNSINSIELHTLGVFSNKISSKYKFIPINDIINLWNSVGGVGSPKNNKIEKKPLGAKTPGKMNNKKILCKSVDPMGAVCKEIVLKSNGKKNTTLLIKEKINSDHCVFNLNKLISKEKEKINSEQCVFNLNKSLSKEKEKINSEHCVFNLNKSLSKEIEITSDESSKEKEIEITSDESSKEKEMEITIDESSKEKEIEIENGELSNEISKEVEKEIIASIIKMLSYDENMETIPNYLTNYLNLNNSVMNIEKIIEYEDIEKILEDINC